MPSAPGGVRSARGGFRLGGPCSRSTASHLPRCASRSTAMRCMLSPIASDGLPRASRLAPTIRSCTDESPQPPDSSGAGAHGRPEARTSSSESNGYEPSRSCPGAEAASGSTSARRRTRIGDRHRSAQRVRRDGCGVRPAGRRARRRRCAARTSGWTGWVMDMSSLLGRQWSDTTLRDRTCVSLARSGGRSRGPSRSGSVTSAGRQRRARTPCDRGVDTTGRSGPSERPQAEGERR
jgi:hypothetical protein